MCRTFLPLAMATLLATACDPEGDPTAVVFDDALHASVVGADLDLEGVWDWRETTRLHLRPPVVALFGIQAEGPVTTIDCEAWGELTLTQNGTAFSGSATQSSWCTTGRGVSFDPSAAFGPGWDLVDGTIVGRSIRFEVRTVAFPCPYKGSVRVTDGQVTALHANGHCEVPKELGNDRIWWVATRQP